MHQTNVLHLQTEASLMHYIEVEGINEGGL